MSDDDLEFTETVPFGPYAERAIASYRGYTIFLETRFPSRYNFLGKVEVESKIGSVSIPERDWRMTIARLLIGEWEQGYYAREGLGWPVFVGDGKCKRACRCIDAWITREEGLGDG